MENVTTEVLELDEDVLIGSSLTAWQYDVLIILGTITSTMSVLGSIAIIIVSRKNVLEKRPYYRLVAGLSVSDIFHSITCMIQPWMLPKELVNPALVTSSFGNIDTCTGNGFLFAASGLGGAMYNGCLSVHFLLIVVYAWRDEQILKYFERYVHILCFLWPVVLCLPAALTQSINPIPFLMICTIAEDSFSHTTLCEEVNNVTLSDCTESADTDSTDIDALFRMVYVATFNLFAVMGLLGTFLVAASFGRQVNESVRHSEFARMSMRSRSVLLKQVKTRSILYSLVFVNKVIWVIISQIIHENSNFSTSHPNGMFAIQLLIYLFFPLQGFLNLLVFIRPKIMAHQKSTNPTPSMTTSFCEVIREALR